jgi:hypothetical protein
MSYQLKVIKDAPVGFWPLDEISGTTALDASGCGNNGTYSGSLTTNILPLVSGGVSASRITNTSYVTLGVSKDYNGVTAKGGFATKDNSDNDFSLEAWFYPKITTTNLTPILADDTNDIGLFYEKGNIVFLAGNQRLDYTVPYLGRTMHLVATYSQDALSLYLDGSYVAGLSLDSFAFTNEQFNPAIGPTQSSSDSFIIDAVAIYRYALKEDQIFNHFIYNKTINVGQIVKPDRGYLFEINDINIHPSFLYRLPADKSLDGYVGTNTDVYYDSKNKNISFIKTDTSQSKTFVIQDFFSIPKGSGLISSKIDWYSDNGITVETSLTGESGTWQACVNGQAIPQYKLGTDTFSTSSFVHFKVTMTSTDTSKYLPIFEYLAFNFYNNKNVISDNSGMFISSKIPLAGDINLTTWDYFLGCDNFPILSRNIENGIKPSQAGFYINSSYKINSVEMLFRPVDLVKNSLIYSEYNSNTISYLWSNSGAITKSNISYIYVNGVDRTSATNISSFLNLDEVCHIVIGFSQPASGDIWFNTKVSSNTWTNGGGRHLYKNIALYETALTSTKAQEHYSLYINRAYASAADSSNKSVTMTEQSVSVYDNDWLVIKNV